MEYLLAIFIDSFLLLSTSLSEVSQESKSNRILSYPDVKRNETIVDDYHGTKIADPYRWLENPDSDETKLFIEQQNNLTNNYIHASPVRASIKRRLGEITDYEKVNCPAISGGKYYYYKNSGLQNQAVLYVQDSLEDEPKVFLDPNTLSEDGTVTIKELYFSNDGEFLAYGQQNSGSDWVTLHFKKTTSGEDLPDKLEYLKFADVAWKKDNSGIYYTRYPKPKEIADGSETEVAENCKIYHHTMGTNQTEDTLLVEFPEFPTLFIYFKLSEDRKYMIVIPEEGIGKHLIYYANLEEPLNAVGNDRKLTLIPIVTKFEASYQYITNDGLLVYFKTDKNAPNYKIIGIDLKKPEEKYWSVLVPEHENEPIYDVSAVNTNYMIVNYIRDVKTVLELRHLSNGTFIKTLSTDEYGASYHCKDVKREATELFYSFTSFLTPKIIYHIDFKNGISDATIWKEAKLNGFNAADYQTIQVFYNSTDGTKVPMYITHKKSLKLNGDLPTYLHGYGGYGYAWLPYFQPDRILFLQNFDGLFAFANIRGGGEYGTKWWNNGRLLNKQQSFNDFQAAAEYLIDEKYTKPSKLFIEGASNGGLLAAACLNQRPELFGAVIIQVGILDMLRFQKFTIGYAWCSEFGCSEDKIHFDNLVKYSPLHNIHLPANESIQYPAVLVLTADHDDRVVPLHSYKYISELQHTIGSNSRQTNPLLIQIVSNAGHGYGKPISKEIEEFVDIYSFLIQSLDYKFHE